MIERKAFTLLEVLISIALMGIVLVALFSSVDLLHDSNQHLATHLEKSKKITQATQVLYKDIVSSDGNITIQKDEFTRLCIESTVNSLYGLNRAKVCWVVMKDKNRLVRIEGNDYRLPTRSEERVEVDTVMKGVELFDVYHTKDKVLVLLKEKFKKTIKFMVQGIIKSKPSKKPKKPKLPKNPKDNNKVPKVNPAPVPIT